MSQRLSNGVACGFPCAWPQQAHSLFQQVVWQQVSHCSCAGGRPRGPVASPLPVRLFVQSLL